MRGKEWERRDVAGRGLGPELKSGPDPGVERRGFEELVVGERFELPETTLTTEHFAAFQALSGDAHPMHYDLDTCRDLGHDDLLAHGLQVAALGAAGAGAFPWVVEDRLLGMISQETRFLGPALRGDTLRPVLEVVELRRQRTTGVVVLGVTVRNQRGELVLEGEQRYLLRLAGGGG